MLATNEDTNLLKCIAAVTMVIDHISRLFFPQLILLQIIGRLSLPLYAYCIVVGCLHTSNIKKYILRLLIFAVISQPCYMFAFQKSFYELNVFFTLLLGLIAVYALKEQKWPLLILVLAVCFFVKILFQVDAIIPMLLIYILRDSKRLLVLCCGILFFCWFFWQPSDITIGSLSFHSQGFALLCLPLIYFHTNSHIRIPKYVFYAIYPAHLLLLGLIKYWLY